MVEYIIVFDRITVMTQTIHAKDEQEAIKKFEVLADVLYMGECEITEIIDYQSLLCPNCGFALKDGVCYNWTKCNEAEFEGLKWVR